ncbi:uncharacterized protein MELLADRAFT_78862 [Melampsora larici-populina 98AG31]|uniref:Cwf19-like C-terminal domain-containing protein n=1 Tax=Melampsora larici-populina (strain 98AG31 / pathotype 3-4-7) TaxID=747676 RepID=F4RZX6_MELLP|nr:uncharacterized protein MELLADRAFT_78862 [Melampsora larici-populina 98AG31]EGG02079.1 hypothetical protein MELLADRAFT_78862 [Melampsora larici-populina 98AG31]
MHDSNQTDHHKSKSHHHDKKKSKDEKRHHKSRKTESKQTNLSDEEASWVEKPIVQSVRDNLSDRTVATSSHSTLDQSNKKTTTSSLKEYGQDSSKNEEVDFFSSLGKEMRGTNVREAAEQQKATQAEEKRMSSSIVRLGAGDPNYKPNDDPPSPPAKPVFGGPGYQWRMTKLKRTYETAAEENRSIEEVAMERYGSLSAWEDAQEESRVINGSQRNHQRSRTDSSKGSLQSTPAREGSDRKYLFSSESGSANRPAFRRPMSGRNTPGSERDINTPSNNTNAHRRVDLLRQESSSKFASPSSSGPSSPVPSALNPLASVSSSPRRPEVASSTGTTTLDLNKLQAALMKAKMMGSDTVPDLEKQYEAALKAKSEEVIPANQERVEVVPTLDGRGRMYDLGSGNVDEAGPSQPGNRRKKEAKVETRDPKTGEFLRYNADDDQLSLKDLVRQEKFQAGSADQKNMDAEMARSIMTDSKYENDLDYIDDNADRLAKKKMKTDASKRLFAINDYSRTKKALESCQFCYGDDGSHPKIGIISSGTKVYLCPPLFEELVPGHCWIVPMQHVLCSLELDDDAWDEIKNYMKCLMRMFSEKFDQGVLFYETILSFKQQRHSYIEAVPISWDLFSDAPAYFKESIMTSESEWSQHKKLIDFSARPGGFRRSMVSNLPYFMVQWDYKGEKGYGHVIEGNDESSGRAGRGENGSEEISSILDEEGKGGEFPRYFAAEIIGNLLDLEPRKWRKPKRLAYHVHQKQVLKFKDELGYSKYDWTGLLTQ